MNDPFRTSDDETPIDVSLLRDKSITTQRELNIAEAANILIAYETYLGGVMSDTLAPFHVTWMCELHEEMFGNVWSHAGRVRQSNLNIGIEWTQVLPQLLELENDLRFWRENAIYPPVEQAARMHHRGTWIHPFLGGNGRWARLLANVWLRRAGEPLTLWPTEMVKTTSIIRGEYLQAIRAADAHDFAPIVALHMRYAATR